MNANYSSHEVKYKIGAEPLDNHDLWLISAHIIHILPCARRNKMTFTRHVQSCNINMNLTNILLSVRMV
jgi:hypothetical protein